MFSLLPVSVAFLVCVAAILTFPLVRRRLTAADHFFYLSAAWVVLGIIFILLIQWLGQENFEWIIDWN